LRTLIVERHVTVRTWWKRSSLEHTLCVNCRKESVPEPMPLYKFAEKLVEFNPTTPFMNQTLGNSTACEFCTMPINSMA
jgi:hypothetical protein